MPGLPTAIQGIARRVALMDRFGSTSPNDVTLSPQGDVKTLAPLGGLRAAAAERAYYIGTSIGVRGTGTTITSATGTAYAPSVAVAPNVTLLLAWSITMGVCLTTVKASLIR